MIHWIWKFVNQCQQNKNINLKHEKYQTKVTKMSSKYCQQYHSKYQSAKSIKSITRSIKITSTGDHHDRSTGHSNDQFTASDNVKMLIMPIISIYFFNKILSIFTPGDIRWPNVISCFSMFLRSKSRFLSTSYVWKKNFFGVYFYFLKPLIFLISIKFRIKWVVIWYVLKKC